MHYDSSLLLIMTTDKWVVPERYDGESNSTGQHHGIGTLYCSNGDIYSGQWKEGHRHGKGTQVYAWKLEMYEGEWADGHWNGNGRLTRVDGSFFEGSFKDGRQHGLAKLTTVDGVTVESAWVDGKLFTGDVRIIWPKKEGEAEPLR